MLHKQQRPEDSSQHCKTQAPSDIPMGAVRSKADLSTTSDVELSIVATSGTDKFGVGTAEEERRSRCLRHLCAQ